MRTTVELPDELFRKAKAEAALRGVSLKILMADALREKLFVPKPSGPTGKVHRVKLPIIKSKRPGSLQITNAQIEEILNEPS